ncbi:MULTISPECIES: hypothetical protein [unclassified Kribbella]|uniref:AbiJ-related protein n=1 Tax=unclassified Kribbella TaxID=2644121 RepID=UPI00307791F4
MMELHVALRDLTKRLVLGLAQDCTHRELDSAFAELGIPGPSETNLDQDDAAPVLTKHQRCLRVFDRLDADHYPAVLTWFLARGLPPPARNEVQDVLWSREQWPVIPERVRRDVAAALDTLAPLGEEADGFMALLHRLWILETDLSPWLGQSLASEVERHVIQNPGDWDVLELFRQLGALSSSDRRFALFIEGLLSGAVTPNEDHQRRMVDAISPALSRAGLKVSEVGETGGYPDFCIVPTGTRTSPPQLILFASTSRKPDLRLSDVLDQEIEVMSANDDVLSYDKPIPDWGLTWNQLQAWWAARYDLAPADAKHSLWSRLRAAVPRNSPPQLALFDEYYKVYGSREQLVALLPEVWLHWDPTTKERRGSDGLLTQRMDFLMLPRGHRRIVLEVDGAQHYSALGRPSPAVYAETTRGDRDLRLSGYEVYRFSGHELQPDRARSTVTEFFNRLLDGPR